MKNLLIISGSLLIFTCCQQQPHTTQGTDTAITAGQQPVQRTDTAVTKTPAISSDKLASAGKGIGKINLGSNAEGLEKRRTACRCIMILPASGKYILTLFPKAHTKNKRVEESFTCMTPLPRALLLK